MSLGLSTYALFWEWSAKNPTPITLEGMIDRTVELGCSVFQICDYPPLETLDDAGLAALRAYADERGVVLEVGTRGTRREHLEKFIDIAEKLGSPLVRSMVQVGEGAPSYEENYETLRALAPRLEELNLRLAFETYEQLPVDDLMRLLDAVDCPLIGVALDPANCVANLETPRSVIDRTARRVLNLHVKDFAFTRSPGWVGFTYAGAPMGEGLLDYEYELAVVNPEERGINQIVEHWLTWQGDIDTTVEMEKKWTEQTVRVMKEYQRR